MTCFEKTNCGYPLAHLRPKCLSLGFTERMQLPLATKICTRSVVGSILQPQASGQSPDNSITHVTYCRSTIIESLVSKRQTRCCRIVTGRIL